MGGKYSEFRKGIQSVFDAAAVESQKMCVSKPEQMWLY
jgi:hypothetical protein